MPSNFYRCFRHETCGSEVKFLAKTTSHSHCSGDVDDVQRRSRFAQKGHNFGDESWVYEYGYDIETKAQSSQQKRPEEPKPKKARQVRRNVKVLLTVLFDCNGVVHHELLSQGRTISNEYYLEVKRRLRHEIRQKRTELWKNQPICTMMTHQYTYRWLCVNFLPKQQNCNHASTTIFTGLGPRWFFPLPKTEDVKSQLRGGQTTLALRLIM